MLYCGLAKDPVIMDKLALCKGMVIDGHAPGLTGEELKAYVEAGVMTEHECTTYEEAKEKCHAGMKNFGPGRQCSQKCRKYYTGTFK